MFSSHDIARLSKLSLPKSAEMPRPESSKGAEGASFSNILKDLLGNSPNTAPASSAATGLSKEQLMLFAKALQIQMNSRLYNTVFNDGLAANTLAAKVMQDYGADVGHRLVPAASNYGQQPPKKDFSGGEASLDKIIEGAAQKYDVDVDLIRSVIKAESNFNPAATSPKGAMGLMQLMPETARDLGVKNPYDKTENVMGGTRYLKILLERYDGQTDLALAAYNWGMGNLEKKPDRLPAETLGYIERVSSHYKKLKA